MYLIFYLNRASNRHIWLTVFAAAWISAIQVLSAEMSMAAEYRCEKNPVIRISAPDSTHVGLICSSAGKAIDFLAGFGLHPRRDIRIEITSEPIDNPGYDAYGTYDSRADRIRLMSIGAIMAHGAAPRIYDEPLNSEHYKGAVAHEVAHAVVHHNIQEPPVSIAPHEYLAHATQMAILSDTSRERIIRRADIDPWLPGDAISDVYMALEPTRFAVKSYLHLTTAPDSKEFVKILLNAKWFYVYVPG